MKLFQDLYNNIYPDQISTSDTVQNLSHFVRMLLTVVRLRGVELIVVSVISRYTLSISSTVILVACLVL